MLAIILAAAVSASTNSVSVRVRGSRDERRADLEGKHLVARKKAGNGKWRDTRSFPLMFARRDRKDSKK